MSLNRVIGAGNRLPWHLPEDFRWFKKMTVGQVIVMGRKTFESIGKPLPDRTTVVLTRSEKSLAGVRSVPDLAHIDPNDPRWQGKEVFVCGGAQVYALALPKCSDLYLTLVKREVEGDAFFPPFEERFELVGKLVEAGEFDVFHYRNRRIE